MKSKPNASTSRKRKRSFRDTLGEAYSSVSFAPREYADDCAPDSPRFFFPSSYTAVPCASELPGGESKEPGDDSSSDPLNIDIRQVVHRHVNGLCMVTAGEFSVPPSKVLKSVRFVAKEAPPCSNAEKRKRQAKMLRGRGKVDNVVSPSTVIAELIFEGKPIDENSANEAATMQTRENKTTIIPLRACVWGTIIELNINALKPEILSEDPLLDGHLAIILPSGEFPPANALQKATDR
mmetsp:Transcript_16014/g.32845  ORF Transcript_16014/g.32845 Transcript_16014/m.32845 type:complete len:237 (-) Transcript_16014:1050-1760(-)